MSALSISSIWQVVLFVVCGRLQYLYIHLSIYPLRWEADEANQAGPPEAVQQQDRALPQDWEPPGFAQGIIYQFEMLSISLTKLFPFSCRIVSLGHADFLLYIYTIYILPGKK